MFCDSSVFHLFTLQSDVLCVHTATWAWVLTEPTPAKGISDGTQQKENAERTFFAFTGLFASVANSLAPPAFANSVCID